MIKQIITNFILLFLLLSNSSYSQNQTDFKKQNKVSKLFITDKILPIRLEYSVKNIKKITNDSTYINTVISYKAEDGLWKTLDTEIRVRGNFRLKKCYYPPIKIKTKKENSKGTLFKGNKKLKMVMPCLTNKDNNDYVLKEYTAYKMFEIISPYHFKTRLLNLEFTEIKGKKRKVHDFYGFLIEDDKKVAKRFDGQVVKRGIHPIGQDDLSSVRNAFFQFMIGNLDYSTAVQHNGKLLYIDKKIIPVPYDFDLSGLVNASYATVPIINDKQLVSSVRDRLYRGFKRDPKIINQVRKEFIDNKSKLLDIVDSVSLYYTDPEEFAEAKEFLMDFFDIITDDNRFQKEILSKLRTK